MMKRESKWGYWSKNYDEMIAPYLDQNDKEKISVWATGRVNNWEDTDESRAGMLIYVSTDTAREILQASIAKEPDLSEVIRLVIQDTHDHFNDKDIESVEKGARLELIDTMIGALAVMAK